MAAVASAKVNASPATCSRFIVVLAASYSQDAERRIMLREMQRPPQQRRGDDDPCVRPERLRHARVVHRGRAGDGGAQGGMGRLPATLLRQLLRLACYVGMQACKCILHASRRWQMCYMHWCCAMHS